ncbi:MAG: branched-chain amino acid ABC transporter permease [Candidatus Rokubacteria bacterium 13_1_40CM_68_15]|nr:MAG: branched-chain amino acid ABC transporter permease [Candidatus Rokubacteria bacterium 13_1_40CM_68_15]
MAQSLNIVLGGVFHAAVLFLVAAGLQLVFGVQKILNLACGSFYALGAYAGVSAVSFTLAAGAPPAVFPAVLVGAGLALALVGPVVERLLRTIYDRDESFQLLLTFALVLMFEDVIRFVWGSAPHQLGNVYLVYGQLRVGGLVIPVYNLVVIAAAGVIAALMGGMLTRTRFGRIVRATAENRRMAEALGVDVSRVYVRVFTLGVALGTVGGALVIPATAAVNEMGIDLIVEAFAVVVIGGLGSMRGAVAGALIVGIMRAVAVATYPEVEMLAIYVVVIAVLVLRPAGLFAKAAA